MALGKLYEVSNIREGVSGTLLICTIWAEGYVGSATSSIEWNLRKPISFASGKEGASVWETHSEMNATIRVNDRTLLDTLLTYDTEDVVVQLGEKISGDILWKGFADLSRLERNSRSPSGVIKIVDGLKLKLDEAFGLTLLEHKTPFEAIVDLVNLTGLDLGFTFATNWYPVDGVSTSSDNPLKQVKLPLEFIQRRIKNKGGKTSGYELLTHILEFYGARIYQGEGYGWKIEQRPTLFNSTQNTFEYDSAGASETAGTVVALAYDDLNFIGSAEGPGGQADLLEKGKTVAYRAARTVFDHGPGVAEEIFSNNEFRIHDAAAAAGSRFTDWTTVGQSDANPSINGIPMEVSPQLFDAEFQYDEAFYAGFAADYVEQESPINVGGKSGDRIVMVIQGRATPRPEPESTFPNYWAWYSIKWNSLWLDKDGDFTSATPVKLPVEYQIDNDIFIRREFDLSSGSFSKFTVRLWQAVDHHTPASFTQTDNFVGYNIEAFAWRGVSSKFFTDAQAEFTEKTVKVGNPAADRLAIDRTFYAGTGPHDSHPAALLLASDDSVVDEMKLDNGTADGSEMIHARLAAIEAFRQSGESRRVRQWFRTDQNRPRRGRHITDGAFNYDFPYFAIDYKEGIWGGERMQIRYDTFSGNVLEEDIPDTDDTIFGDVPPQSQIPELLAIVPGPPVIDYDTLLYSAVVSWIAKRGVGSVKYDINLTGVEPDWSTIPTGGSFDGTSDTLDFPIRGNGFLQTSFAPLNRYWIFMRPFAGAGGTGEQGLTKVIFIDIPEIPGTINNGLPPDCLESTPRRAIFPGVGSGTLVYNVIRNLAANPDGVLTPNAANFAFSASDGLSKTATGTTDTVEHDDDTLGAAGLVGFSAVYMLKNDEASGDITFFDADSGGLTQVVAKWLSTGKLELAVTNEASATTTLTSTFVVPSGSPAIVGFSIDFVTGDLHLFVRIPGGGTERIVDNRDGSLNGNFTEWSSAAAGKQTLRFWEFLGDYVMRTLEDFNEEADCVDDWAADLGESVEESGEPDTLVSIDNDKLEARSYAGTVRLTHTLTNKPTVEHRPAWCPATSKFYWAKGTEIYEGPADMSSETLFKDLGKTVRSLRWHPGRQRLYYCTGNQDFEPTTEKEFGYFQPQVNATETVVDSSVAIVDFAVSGDLLLTTSGSTGVALRDLDTPTTTLRSTTTTNNVISVEINAKNFAAVWQESNGDVFALALDDFVSTPRQYVDGSGASFSNVRKKCFAVDGVADYLFTVQNEEIERADSDAELQTSTVNIDDLAAQGRGLSLMAYPGVSPPDPATDLIATVLGATSVKLDWTDNADNENGYEVWYKDLTNGGAWTRHNGQLAANTITATVTGLTAETLYRFRVAPFNDEGYADPWATVEATTDEATSYNYAVYESGGSLYVMALSDGTETQLTTNIANPTYGGVRIAQISDGRIVVVSGASVKAITVDDLGAVAVADRFTQETVYTFSSPADKPRSFWYDSANDRLYVFANIIGSSHEWGYFTDFGNSTWTYTSLDTTEYDSWTHVIPDPANSDTWLMCDGCSSDIFRRDANIGAYSPDDKIGARTVLWMARKEGSYVYWANYTGANAYVGRASEGDAAGGDQSWLGVLTLTVGTAITHLDYDPDTDRLYLVSGGPASDLQYLPADGLASTSTKVGDMSKSIGQFGLVTI